MVAEEETGEEEVEGAHRLLKDFPCRSGQQSVESNAIVCSVVAAVAVQGEAVHFVSDCRRTVLYVPYAYHTVRTIRYVPSASHRLLLS